MVDEADPSEGAVCGAAEGECGEGALTCTDGVLVCLGEVEPTEEICDGLDNDCDESVDEGLLMTLYQDLDEDDVGSDVECTQCGECEGMGPWVVATGDCNDTCATCSPVQLEVCDGLDNDCDGEVDEELIMTFYSDEDHDAFGVDEMPCMSCSLDECEGEDEDWVMVGGDCDATRDDVFPGALEVCDGVDNNCDGSIDEGLAVTYYRDADGDGYGTDETCQACTASECPGGAGWATVNGDCDDSPATGASVNPGIPEVCDHVDNNCDGGVDEGVDEVVYTDMDGDGYGVGAARRGCPDNPAVEPNGAARVDGDCADGDARAHPGVAGFLSDPIVGPVPSGLRFDFDCDGREEPEFRPCFQGCLFDHCWESVVVGGVDLSRPACGERGSLDGVRRILDRCIRDQSPTLENAACR